MKQHSFSKKEHLTKNALIQDVFRLGIPFRGRLIKLYLLKRDINIPSNRIAFIVKKELCAKKSVLRNRFRRILRESYRTTKELFPIGYDIIILADRVTISTKTPDLKKDIAYALKRCINK